MTTKNWVEVCGAVADAMDEEISTDAGRTAFVRGDGVAA